MGERVTAKKLSQLEGMVPDLSRPSTAAEALQAFPALVAEARRFARLQKELMEWTEELGASGSIPGGVGPFLAEELRRRMRKVERPSGVPLKAGRRRRTQEDPLADAEAILRGEPLMDYDDNPQKPKGSRDRAAHYGAICISMYNQDLVELDAKVAELKRRGWTKANKSHLIRIALAQLDLDKIPAPHR